MIKNRVFGLLALLLLPCFAFSQTINLRQNNAPLPFFDLEFSDSAKPPKVSILRSNILGQIEIPIELTFPIQMKTLSNEVTPAQFKLHHISSADLEIDPIQEQEFTLVSGVTTKFTGVRTDGKLDVGIVMPAIPTQKILDFDLNWLLSTEIDTIEVLGRELKLPSNLTLPEQKERYIFSFTLDKPYFKMPIAARAPMTILGLHIQAPLNRVIDDFRADVPAYEMINYGKIVEAGKVTIAPHLQNQNLNLEINQIPFSHQIEIPALKLNVDDVVLLFGLSEADGLLMPTDIKRLQSGKKQSLNFPHPTPGQQTKTLAMWMKSPSVKTKNEPISRLETIEPHFEPDELYRKFSNHDISTESNNLNFRRASLSIQNPAGSSISFLDLIETMNIENSQIKVSVPRKIEGLTQFQTLVSIYAVEINKTQPNAPDKLSKLWSSWSDQWESEISLPELKTLSQIKRDKIRLEVIFTTGHGSGVSHVSRNSIDIISY